MTDLQLLTVGQVAEEVGVSVRTLHHYDEIGLVVPSERSFAGYRLYTEEDLTRLQHVVVYRRLGFGLEEVAALLEQDADVLEHLRRQRSAITDRIGELTELVRSIDAAMESEMSGYQITREEQREIFGDNFTDNFDDYQAEAEQRWGDTDAWKESSRRTKSYTKEQWEQIKVEQDQVNARFVELLEGGEPADSEAAMDAAEEARQQICRWFYDCPRGMHASIAQMYVDDPRFTKTYEDIAPGLAQFVRDAAVANAARG
ncbi:transcriptional regulator [Serinicoccus sp. CUA-874]|uniref:MerR family transcriptional regulator n=1 Tax=Serinicoccus sp. CUA-874 TaxID=1517939 RepID=UPI000961E5A6|nr:MerR family transcriptional regulator [Serinicoccus sp. CUA-874]OLT18368.1 transcriptional regulator [Serinicoccus sp. CUA-874]